MSLPSGTVTFLFTDIEGSTRLWEHYPETMAQALTRHDHLLRNIIRASNGVVFKTLGDAFCTAFATATDAVNAALAAQLALLEPQVNHGENGERGKSPAPTKRTGQPEIGAFLSLDPVANVVNLRVRMALHTGVAEERSGDYFGATLSRVARLLELSHGGQILLSQSTYELTCDLLPEGASLLDLGEHRLRDLARPEHVFQLLHPSLPAAFPSLKSLDSLPTNLPQQVTSFIGRGREMAEVKRLLSSTRLLTLTGTGGAGKTRLALQVAAELLETYADGVWLIDLAPLSEPGLVGQTAAQVLGVPEEVGYNILQTLADTLQGKRMLLVLDNCEHLLGACAQLAEVLLRSCSQLKILATSREALNIAGEQTYRVPSLSLPQSGYVPPLESLAQYEALRLFIERARSHEPVFAVTDANAGALVQVCQHLDGIPLAIELAAARVRVLKVEEIAKRLSDRFRLLTGGNRTAMPRQQTLRALIDWSYDLLNARERALLRRLSVFAGGWTLEAAEAVCSADEEKGERKREIESAAGPALSPFSFALFPEEVLDLLTSLVDKSLVIYEEQAGRARYRLLETMRQYARERLSEQGEDRMMRIRHYDYFLQLAEEATAMLQGPEQAIWLERLEIEHDNLRTALDWRLQDPEGGEAGLRLTAALQRFWSIRGYLYEGRERYAAALAHPGAQERSEMRANALNGAGILAWMQGDIATVRPLQEESLAIQREIGDRQGAAFSLVCLGNAVQDQGDYKAAQALYEEGVALYRDLGNRKDLPIALICLGNSLWKQGDHTAARTFFEEALALDREIGHSQGTATALIKLVQLALSEGDYAAAAGPLRECLPLLLLLRDKRITAFALEGCAAVARSQGRTRRAARLWGAAQSLREEIGSPIPHNMRDDYEREVAAVGAALGEEAIVSAWGEGRTLSFDQALEYAMADTAD